MFSILILCLISATVHASASETTETITLRGDYSITGHILKQDNKRMLVDVGFTVISVPAAEILSISDNNGQVYDSRGEFADGFYQARVLKRRSTSEAAEEFAPAVVVVRSPGGLGSGFFVNKEGYLITNFHVIKGHNRISVTRFLKENSELKRIIHNDVRIVASDPFYDIAVLKVEDENSAPLAHVVFSPEDKPALGETIFVIGNPLGLERTLTQGVISQVARRYMGKLYLQLDAPVNPGNSGGPLFNARGEVIGVINMGIPSMQGLNFAIPARRVKFILDNISDFAYDRSNSESGFVYPDPPPNPQKEGKPE